MRQRKRRQKKVKKKKNLPTSLHCHADGVNSFVDQHESWTGCRSSWGSFCHGAWTLVDRENYLRYWHRKKSDEWYMGKLWPDCSRYYRSMIFIFCLLINNYSMSGWIWVDYNYVISNKREWNYCFIKDTPIIQKS